MSAGRGADGRSSGPGASLPDSGLPRLAPRLLLVVRGNHRTIPPAHALRVKRLVPGATMVTLAGLGHLAHEEQPAAVAQLVVQLARETGVPLPP